MSWTDTTNLEDCHVTQIECSMYMSGRKYTIADIIDVIEICHILSIMWPIFYNEAKPLKYEGGQLIRYHASTRRQSNIPQTPV
jgi:hypothetical protein